MANNIERDSNGLPVTTKKELAAMNQLFRSEHYRIKERDGALRRAKKDLVSSNFIINSLNDFIGHIQAFVTAARKMAPRNKDTFFSTLERQNPIAAGIIKTAVDIDLKTLNNMLNRLQDSARNVSVAAMQPFVKALYKDLIRVYYLDPEYTSSCIREAYQFILANHVPSDPEGFRKDTMSVDIELKYIYNNVFPAMYPLVLRMVSPVMLSEHDLFYKNGSKVLEWLEVTPDKILFPQRDDFPLPTAIEEEQDKQEEPPQIPENVTKGLETLERFFPKAGWKKILDFPDKKTDFAPYFASILQLSDTFIQLSPDHPLHFTMLLFQILSELFKGLRHVDFNEFHSEESIYDILDDWIMYMESVFDKKFGGELKAYTHQVYSRPDFAKNAYAENLIANMHSIIRQYFLPFFDMRLYPIQKKPVDRLPPLYPRIKTLREMLESSIRRHPGEITKLAEAANASAPYRFDVPTDVSKRLGALCSCHGWRKTNGTLIKCCISVLSVLDWWMNDSDSPAYKVHPNLVYRTEGESLIPVFGITKRSDTEEIFKKSLKRASSAKDAEKPPV